MEEKERHDKIAMIEEAMELIEQAQELVDDAVDGTGIEANYKGYGRYGFDQLLGNGNKYDGNLLKLIEAIKTEGKEETEYED